MTDNDEKVEVEQEKSEKNDTECEKPDLSGIREGDWMLKPCDVYWAEYKDCKSIGARFYQNFYYGETLNCSQWKLDYENCKKWQNSDDDTAYNELLASEKIRRLARLKPHIKNDVWKPRKEPPSDWNEPLPDWMVKRHESTFLAGKQNEINATGIDTQRDVYVPSCSIL